MLLAVYGTLRRGDYNHERMELQDFPLLATEQAEGFEMFNLGGSYPYIAVGADMITIEVYEVPEEIFRPIESMELGAGYVMSKVKTSVGLAVIFCMSEDAHARYQTRDGRPPKIVSGDWFQWLRKYSPDRLREFNNVIQGDSDAN